MYSNPNLDHVCCSESIAAAAAAARVNISTKVADVERVNQRVDEAHVSLTGASLMDVVKPGQQAAAGAAAAVAG